MWLLFFFVFAVTAPKPGPTPSSSSNPKPPRRSMPSPYRLPTPLPQLPVRKGIRGRRPKSETIALLKALAASTAAQDTEDPGVATPQTTPISQLPLRPYKKRGPKPGSKVALTEFCVYLWRTVTCDNVVEGVSWWNTDGYCVFMFLRGSPDSFRAPCL